MSSAVQFTLCFFSLIVHGDNFGIKTQNLLSNIQKTWIIDGAINKIYSPIDKSLFILKNGTLSENFAIKSLKKSYKLGNIVGKKFKWNNKMPKNVFERRGNFENLTFIAMTDLQSPYNLLPDHWENIASISNVVPNTFEVGMNTFDSF